MFISVTAWGKKLLVKTVFLEGNSFLDTGVTMMEQFWTIFLE